MKYKLFRKNKDKGSTLVELITVVAIMSTLTSVVAPVYINSLQKAKALADEVSIVNASNLATSMYVMQDLQDGDVMYYTSEATLVPNKYQLIPYGQTPENQDSIIKVTVHNDQIYAEWVSLKK